jgi:uncharacterized protein YjbI with pentapeptide repeats
MYAEMPECNLAGSDISRANFMWANMQKSDLTGSKLSNTIFVEANMRDVKIANIDKKGAYLKYAKLEGSPWQVISNNNIGK